MIDPNDVGLALIAQVSDHLNGRKLPVIEAEIDDEGASSLLSLERWQDRYRRRAGDLHPRFQDRW